jgi:ParB-like chromosome segregation protein Spo0J
MLNFKSAAEPAFDYDNLEAHELANLLPMIDDANFANLKADIEKNGVLEPILIFEGRILDGRNRYRAGKEVRRLTPAKFKMFEGDYAAAEAYVFSTNFLRRQMSPAEKQEVICKMLAKYPNESIRQIAKRCGTSHSYVQKIKDKLNEPSPEQKEFTEFCKTWDALSEPRRAEFVKSFAPDIRDLLAVSV